MLRPPRNRSGRTLPCPDSANHYQPCKDDLDGTYLLSNPCTAFGQYNAATSPETCQIAFLDLFCEFLFLSVVLVLEVVKSKHPSLTDILCHSFYHGPHYLPFLCDQSVDCSAGEPVYQHPAKLRKAISTCQVFPCFPVQGGFGGPNLPV